MVAMHRPDDMLSQDAQDYLAEQVQDRLKGLPAYIVDLLGQLDAAFVLKFLDENEAKLRKLPQGDGLTDIEKEACKRLGVKESAYIKAKNVPDYGEELIARLASEAEEAAAKRGTLS